MTTPIKTTTTNDDFSNESVDSLIKKEASIEKDIIHSNNRFFNFNEQQRYISTLSDVCLWGAIVVFCFSFFFLGWRGLYLLFSNVFMILFSLSELLPFYKIMAHGFSIALLATFYAIFFKIMDRIFLKKSIKEKENLDKLLIENQKIKNLIKSKVDIK